MREAVAFGPLVVLSVLAFLVIGTFALIPLAAGAVPAGLFTFRRSAGTADAFVGLIAGLLVWFLALFLVAVLFVEFD